MGDRLRGLYGKFFIERTDGKSAPGQKHDGCDYFVLDLTHDPHALPALRAYADSCRPEYPLLALDLYAKLPDTPPPPAALLPPGSAVVSGADRERIAEVLREHDYSVPNQFKGHVSAWYQLADAVLAAIGAGK